jgi:hypothetical protein
MDDKLRHSCSPIGMFALHLRPRSAQVSSTLLCDADLPQQKSSTFSEGPEKALSEARDPKYVTTYARGTNMRAVLINHVTLVLFLFYNCYLLAIE